MSKTKKWLVSRNRSTKRSLSLVAVFLLVLSVLFPVLYNSSAAAYGQVQSRTITMSSSANGSLTAGQNVTYTIAFNAATTNTGIKGIVVNFCSADPIVDDTCGATLSSPPAAGSTPNITTTSGFGITYSGCSSSCSWSASTTFPSPTPTTTQGTCGSTGYSSAPNTLYLTNATGQTINSGGTVTITLPGVTNPTTTNTEFYARIFTFTSNVQTNATAADNYCPDGNSNLVNIVDAGGVALSTAAQITITSRVQEVLQFCLYESAATSGGAPTTGDGGNCSGSGTAVTLGGGTNGVLSFQGPYVDTDTHYDIQSNASGASPGVAIVFTGEPESIGPVSTCQSSTTSCLESSTASGTGSTAGTSYASTAGSPQFGLCTYPVAGNTGNLVPAAPYNSNGTTNCNTVTQTAGFTAGTGGNGTAQFGFNTTASTSASGSTLATFTNPGAYATGDIAFIGNIAANTVPGIYQTTLTFIATGTY